MKAVIFDMDGVISDTQKIHSDRECRILQRYGVRMSPEEISAKYAGVGVKDFFTALLKDKNCDINTLVKEKWTQMLNLKKGEITPIPGVIELIHELKQNNFKLAVASASIRDFIERVLTELNIKDKFDAITSTEDVKRGKPEPDVFLLAAEKLGVKPQNCTVIEDGISGMIAAKKAGMNCIGLINHEGNYPADILVDSLRNLRLKDFNN